MRLKTIAVEIAGITHEPHKAWKTQIARNLTDARDGFLRGAQCLTLDRGPLCTAAFRPLLRGSGAKPTGPACQESKVERVCRAVCGVRRVRVPRADRATRRRAPPGCRTRLSSIITRSGRTKVWATSSFAPKTTSIGTDPVKCRARAWRVAQVLLSRGRVALRGRPGSRGPSLVSLPRRSGRESRDRSLFEGVRYAYLSTLRPWPSFTPDGVKSRAPRGWARFLVTTAPGS